MHFLTDFAIIFGIALVVILIFNLLKIPYLVGYILTGVLLNPNVTGLVGEETEVEVFAEVGVILLLFTVGLEFSFSKLMRIKRYVFLGGSLQMLFTVVLAALITLILGLSVGESIVLGLILSLSSTAIVIKQLQDRVQLNKEFGKIALAVLLFQDIAVVPVMLFLPMLGDAEANVLQASAILIGKLALLGLVAWVLTKYVIPRLLAQVMKVKSQEVFLVATVFIISCVTLLTSWMDLSLALGAFIAGLIIAETDYNRLAISCYLPFRYIFISFFFISLGLLVDYHTILNYPLQVIGSFVGVLLLKVLAMFFAGRTLRVDRHNSLRSAVVMAQVGEFSFILAGTALGAQLLSDAHYQIFILVAVLTMSVTPFLIEYSAKIADKFAPANPSQPNQS